MANKVTIDVEARFIDNVTDQANAAAGSFDNIEKSAKDAQTEVDKLGKKKVKPSVDADDSKIIKKLKDSDKRLAKLGRTKAEAKLDAQDKATSKILKVLDKAKSFGGKTYSAILKIRDSGALNTLNKMSNGLKNIAGKTWSTMVKIKDYATAPLRKLKESLFSIKSLVMTITAGLAAKQFVINPIGLADQYSSAKIGFSTLLGESQGQAMMDQIDAFAKATPFKTSGVISNVQKMMAYGWDPEKVIEDMGIIGDAAAATGKGDEGLGSIVYALSEIRSKGKLSTQELNQLASAGIKAKQYLAQGLGFGTDDAGLMKLSEALEDGAVGANQAIELILEGMKEFDGMMDKTANETVTGLKSQLEDTFEINVFRRWGQGLQDGAKKSFGSIVKLLDDADAALQGFGDTVYEVGKTISNWLADKLENAVARITEITDSFEFKNATLGEKISMLWNGVIVDPLMEWWDGGGREKTAETAGKIGAWMGETLTKGLLAIFGATDILDDKTGENAGSSVAGSFLQGFLDNFDGSAITQAFVDAIKNVWGALPWWAKMLIGGYGVGKAAGGIANFAGGVANFIGGTRNSIGGFNIASSAFPILTSSGSGILGAIGKAGVGLGASTTGGALLAGAGGIAGGIAGGAALIKGGIDMYKGYHTDDTVEAAALKASGNTAVGATLAGAAIGTAIAPGIGTLIGAGIGGIAGWIGGDAWAKNIRAAKYDSEEMKEAVKDSEISAEELAQTLAKAKWENAREHFGDIKLSMEEITRLADQIVWGDDMGNFEQFTTSVQAAENALQSMKTASEQTNRWMWKAGLGVKFNDDEKKAFKQSFDDYINGAKSYVENKHYEFTAAVSLLTNVSENGKGKSIIESGNAFYGKLQEQLNELGGKLSENVEIALKDGVITLDEQKEITNLQQQIASITEKIANAEQKAELELIKLKFGNGNLDYESFENFMSQMQTTIDERMSANDKAFVASVSSLNLQLEEGAITKEEYDKQLQTVVDGYTGTVEKLQAEVKDVELQMIGDAYADELGKDATEDLNRVLQWAIDNGIDPIKITDEKMASLLNIELDENGETISNIRDMLSGVFSHLELLEVDGNLMIKIGEVKTEVPPEEKVVEIVDSSIPDSMDEEIGINITAFSNIMNNVEILAKEFGIKESYAETILWRLSSVKGIENKLEILCTEFGINQTEAETILWKLSGRKSIMNTFSLVGSDFGIKNSYTFRPTINLNPVTGNVTAPAWQKALSGGGFRGGIFGGDSAMDAFARGGETDNSGIVGGSTRYIRVNEESPEMIIPLSSQRRERALKLWTKTGEMLGVPGYARGGSTGNRDEGLRFHSYGGNDANGGQTVQVEVGGIQIEINVNGNDKEGIAEAIKAQVGDIADYVVGRIADELAGQFENTPVRGGVA